MKLDFTFDASRVCSIDENKFALAWLLADVIRDPSDADSRAMLEQSFGVTLASVYVESGR